MLISDWSSDVCSSDLFCRRAPGLPRRGDRRQALAGGAGVGAFEFVLAVIGERGLEMLLESPANVPGQRVDGRIVDDDDGDVAVLLHRDADGGIFGHGRTPWSNGSIVDRGVDEGLRSEEHTSELQSLMRISYAVFCLKKKNNNKH